MKATLLDYMGSDLTVVNAARVSFAKSSRYEHTPGSGEFTLPDKDIKLIHYLASHHHFTPFTHPQLSFHIEAPIFVAKQLWKSHIGVSGGQFGYGGWNEVSRRYVDEDVSYHFFNPRERSKKAKQGSGEGIRGDATRVEVYAQQDEVFKHCDRAYKRLLELGVAPEQARAVLPLATYTEWHWTGSLAFFARVAKLRLSEDTQKETRDLVYQMSILIEPLFPHSWKALWQS